MAETLIRFTGVSKNFGENAVVKELDLEIRDGEFLTLLGPSGCGKTTILRMIAGFETPDTGDILLCGESIVHLPPQKRQVNTVFQSYALFPHLTVRENIAFGLRMNRTNRLEPDEINTRVDEILALTELEALADRKPAQISGGQKQRTAIARSLVNRPRVLLLDEPLGALDLKLRKNMQTEIKRLQRRLSGTYVYVTHDQEEALTMSDRIAVMHDGRIEQIGTPQDIYLKPASAFVGDFVGESNIIVQKSSQSHRILIRPEMIEILTDMSAEDAFPCIVREVVFMGQMCRIGLEPAPDAEIMVAGGEMLFAYETASALRPGQQVYARWDAAHTTTIHSDRTTDRNTEETVNRTAKGSADEINSITGGGSYGIA